MKQYEWDQYNNMSENDVLREIISGELADLERRRGKIRSRKQAKTILIYTAVLAASTGLFAILPPGARGFLLPISLVAIFLFGGFVQALASCFSSGGCGCLLLLVPLFSIFWDAELPPMTVTFLGILFYFLIYCFLIWVEYKLDLADRLADQVKAEPDKDIHFIVRDCEDLYFEEEEKTWIASKWLVAVLLVLAVAFSAMGIFSCYSESMTSDTSVETANRSPEANYVWQRVDEGYVLQDFDAGTKEVNPNIPAQIDGIPVVAIGDRAFQNETRVTSIAIPDSITEIGSYAFKGCTSLQTITMGDQVTAIGGEAFYGCSRLTEFVVPKGVTEIRGNTFQNCSLLKNIRLHDGITAIHGYAFLNCRTLESIDLPSGITEIRAYTFESCASLKEIRIPEGVTRIAAHAFYGCTSLSDVTVPMSVTEIGSSAFRECTSLKQIIVPEGCAVDERAFKDSPTSVIYQYMFTPEQEAAIREEVENSHADILYYIYANREGEILHYIPNDDGYVYMSNSSMYLNTVVAGDIDLFYGKLTNDQEVLDYLILVREQGATTVFYAVHSEIASEITGTYYVVDTFIDIDDMIEQCKAGLAES